MENLQVKIIRLPSFFRKRQFSSKPNCCLIPPLGLGLIVAYLRSKGISIEQDDLNIKIHYDNYYSSFSSDKIDIEVFYDLERIQRYSNGGEDTYIDSIMEKIDSKVKIIFGQILLLSLPDNIENESNLAFAMAFTRHVKKKYNCFIILGGQGLWLSLLKRMCNCENIDYMIEGEGEYPLYHLLSSLINNRPMSNAKDLSLLEDGKTIFATRVNETIKPDFSGLPIEKYRSREEVLDFPEEVEGIMKEFQEKGALILPYKLMKGCPYECVFCVSASQKLQYVLTPREVVSHLISLQKEYNPTGYFFMSDTINISKKYINDLCDQIISNRLKILWSDCARIDNLDRETLFKMREAGCIRLIFGMETGSPRLLEYINKKIDLKNLEDVLRWTDEAGIWTGIEVICGFPHEKEEDIEATIAFLNKNKRYLNRIYLNYFDLRQNTPLYNSPQKFNIAQIIKVDQYTEKDFSSFIQFGFDEYNGLSWKEKQKQIDYSVKRVREGCNQNYQFFTDEHLLFYLYSNFDNKDMIESIYLKILESKS